MKKIFLSLFLLSSASFLMGQSSKIITQQFNWEDQPFIHNPFELNVPMEIYSFEGAFYREESPTLPVASHRFQVASQGKLSIEIINIQFESLDKKATEDDDFIQNEIVFSKKINKNRLQYFADISFIPIIKTTSGEFQKVTNIEFKVNFKPSPTQQIFRGPNTYTSALSDGDIYRVNVDKNGMYKLTYDFLKTELGIDNLDNIDPRKIQVLGNGGGMLPEAVSVARIDDLQENAIFISGENDGSFDGSDYILFYGEGAGEWNYSTTNDIYSFTQNYYSNAKSYFIKIGSTDGLRVGSRPSLSSTDYIATGFDDFSHFEDDQRNLLHEYENAQGSGKLWFGDIYSITNERFYSNLFSFGNLEPGENAIISGRFAGRSSSSSKFNVKVGTQQFSSNNISGVSLTNVEGTYAQTATILQEFQPQGSTFDITLNYISSGESTGWLDYLTLNVRRQLTMPSSASQMIFRDKKSLAFASTTFNLANANGAIIWDITNPLSPISQENTAGSFGVETENLKTFIAFLPAENLNTPEAKGKVENQNLHGLDNVDMVIVYPNADFEEVAEKLREHRSTFSNLVVEKVRLDHIYNEFSGGANDICAIRDFAKMLHDRSPQFKYLLLFGDGSFDYKNIKELNVSSDGETFHNLIPPYETNQSLNGISAYPSDDFFGLLSDGEGTATLSGDLDISIGRIPIKNIEEANNVVNKIINYDSSPSTLGDWRLRTTYIGDDEDSGRHTIDADKVSVTVLEEHNVFNQDKIYFDAFQQVSTPGGQRFPAATEAINQNLFKGVLSVNYLGHGGGGGWAQERVLRSQHIVDWENFDKLPILVTATCSFTGYDEPNFVTAGELSFINEKGGVMGLFTTVRSVFASQNFALTKAAYENMFDRVNGETYTIGDILRNAKNDISDNQNKRKFALIGDPAQKLAIPEYNIVTTTINQSVVDSMSQDTIKALQTVTIEGQIEDFSGNLLSDFNGTLFPTIFDKPIEVSTLQQDEGSPEIKFKIQKNVIFKGVASVTNGTFQFTFVVPKDINYSYGFGKISYYAHDGVSKDAAGYYDKIVIGGTDNNVVADDQPPVIEVYMNNEEFVFGGLTDENPILLVKLSDDNGINVVGNSIGHDLTGVLDENTQETYVLNDFYESELDDHTKGTVRYPLFNLEEGLHKIKVRAWDVANNPAEGYTEFIVANSAEVALDHVLNYPNPFMENTSFQFEHNLPNQLVDVQIRVFSVSGKIVKTIDEQVMTEGTRITGIQWDGTDDYGGQLSRGVYLYKVKIGGSNSGGDSINAESEFEKLVILK